MMWRIVMMVGWLSVGAVPALAQDRATIEKLNDVWTAAFDKGDAAAVAALYTEDAYVLPPGSEMVKGRAAIEAFWRQAAQQMGDAKLTTVDVLPLGPEAAREVGTVTLKTKTQPPQEVVGKYVVVWRKVGGDWKLATDIWNTNK
jgi:uncharacterized protein (TIGR02246 family)